MLYTCRSWVGSWTGCRGAAHNNSPVWLPALPDGPASGSWSRHRGTQRPGSLGHPRGWKWYAAESWACQIHFLGSSFPTTSERSTSERWWSRGINSPGATGETFSAGVRAAGAVSGARWDGVCGRRGAAHVQGEQQHLEIGFASRSVFYSNRTVHWQLRGLWGGKSESTWKPNTAPEQLLFDSTTVCACCKKYVLKLCVHKSARRFVKHVSSVKRAADFPEFYQTLQQLLRSVHSTCPPPSWEHSKLCRQTLDVRWKSQVRVYVLHTLWYITVRSRSTRKLVGRIWEGTQQLSYCVMFGCC